jgi:hypothetical protein
LQREQRWSAERCVPQCEQLLIASSKKNSYGQAKLAKT